jgi:hypothetical protein
MRGHERVEGKQEGLARKGIRQQLVLRNMPLRLREASYGLGYSRSHCKETLESLAVLSY